MVSVHNIYCLRFEWNNYYVLPDLIKIIIIIIIMIICAIYQVLVLFACNHQFLI